MKKLFSWKIRSGNNVGRVRQVNNMKLCCSFRSVRLFNLLSHKNEDLSPLIKISPPNLHGAPLKYPYKFNGRLSFFPSFFSEKCELCESLHRCHKNWSAEFESLTAFKCMPRPLPSLSLSTQHYLSLQKCCKLPLENNNNSN